MSSNTIDIGKFEHLAAQLPPDGYLRIEHLATNKKKGRIGITGLSEPTIWRRSREGTFPEAVQIGARATGWRIAEIRQWLENPAGYDQNLLPQKMAAKPSNPPFPVRLAEGETPKPPPAIIPPPNTPTTPTTN